MPSQPQPDKVGENKELTARERQVLLLTSSGLTGPQIADKLGVSKETVKKFKHTIMRKMDAKTMTEAVTIYLIENDQP